MTAKEILTELKEQIEQIIMRKELVISYVAKDKNYPVAATLTHENEARKGIIYLIDKMLDKIEQKKEA